MRRHGRNSRGHRAEHPRNAGHRPQSLREVSFFLEFAFPTKDTTATPNEDCPGAKARVEAHRQAWLHHKCEFGVCGTCEDCQRYVRVVRTRYRLLPKRIEKARRKRQAEINAPAQPLDNPPPA